MIKNLIENYHDFHDALITEISYFNGYNFFANSFEMTTLKVIISCFNIKREYKNDLIEINCEGIRSFIYEKWDGMIFETFIKEENGEITLDFSRENVRDLFVVKCQKVSYRVLEQKS